MRVASTTLAQADSAVGVKCGVNLHGVKNMLGVFVVPWAVIHDTAMLRSLSQRDWRAGFAEAVKVALIKDANFFGEIMKQARDIRCQQPGTGAGALGIIARSAQLHYQHILRGGGSPGPGSGRTVGLGPLAGP